MRGPQSQSRGKNPMERDISWRDLGGEIEKACLDSSQNDLDIDPRMLDAYMEEDENHHDYNDNHNNHNNDNNDYDSQSEEDAKMPAKKMYDNTNTNTNTNMAAEASMLRQLKNPSQRSQRHTFATSRESEISWRDLTGSIEQALDSSTADFGYNHGHGASNSNSKMIMMNNAKKSNGNSTTTNNPPSNSRKSDSLFESFRNLDGALEQAMHNSISGGSNGRRGDSLFESFTNLDEAMALAMQNSLMDNDCNGMPNNLETFLEEEESDLGGNNDLSISNRDIPFDIGDAGYESYNNLGNSQDSCNNKTKITTTTTQSSFDKSRTRRRSRKTPNKEEGGRCAGLSNSRGSTGSNSASILSISDRSGDDLSKIQQQLQQFALGEGGDDDDDEEEDDDDDNDGGDDNTNNNEHDYNGKPKNESRPKLRRATVDTSSTSTRKSLRRMNSSASEGDPSTSSSSKLSSSITKMKSKRQSRKENDLAASGSTATSTGSKKKSSKISSKKLMDIKSKLRGELSRSAKEQQQEEGEGGGGKRSTFNGVTANNPLTSSIFSNGWQSPPPVVDDIDSGAESETSLSNIMDNFDNNYDDNANANAAHDESAAAAAATDARLHFSQTLAVSALNLESTAPTLRKKKQKEKRSNKSLTTEKTKLGLKGVLGLSSTSGSSKSKH